MRSSLYKPQVTTHLKALLCRWQGTPTLTPDLSGRSISIIPDCCEPSGKLNASKKHLPGELQPIFQLGISMQRETNLVVMGIQES